MERRRQGRYDDDDDEEEEDKNKIQYQVLPYGWESLVQVRKLA